MRSRTMLNGQFEVFEDGRINRIRGQKNCAASVVYISRDRKYAAVSYTEDGKRKKAYVHRLVAEAFLPNPQKLPQVNHIDGNPKNNHVSNLEWCTPSHNVRHAYSTGLINRYRENKVCACCGKQISDSNQSGLCGECKTYTRDSKRYCNSKVFIGVIEFHKSVNDMTNADIAELTGYSKDTIGDFMCGKRMSKKVYQKICELFGIDSAYFADAFI